MEEIKILHHIPKNINFILAGMHPHCLLQGLTELNSNEEEAIHLANQKA